MASISPPSPSSPSSPSSDLFIFGYGSLTWKPSPDLASSPLIRQGILTDGLPPSGGGSLSFSSPSTFLRVWCQRSCDHRGTPSSFGIVCTLLRQKEILAYRQTHGLPDAGPWTPPDTQRKEEPQGVLGTLYLLQGEKKASALAHLNHREKGGYDQELVTCYMLEPTSSSSSSSSGSSYDIVPVQALLYRGSLSSPNNWGRLLISEDALARDVF